MTGFNKSLSLRHIQWIIWITLFVILVLALLPYDPWTQAVAYSLINIAAYVIIIYGNASFLLPRLYEKNKKFLYVLLALSLVAAVGFMRSYISLYVYNHFFAIKPSAFRWSGVLTSWISAILVYVSSILFYIALNFFKLKRTQEQLQKRHAEAELNLLKAQVQPHFLFNTLNNIYFVAQRESPATADLLEKLSQIMRYFVDEAPKDRISLTAEMNFIRSYIELEKLRMRYPLSINITEDGINDAITVPPMLLIPLVENVFKHGIDKRRNDNFIYMSLSIHHNRLNVIVENRLIQPSGMSDKSETGLRNLKSRLALLFGNHCELQAGDSGNIFHAQLNIPL